MQSSHEPVLLLWITHPSHPAELPLSKPTNSSSLAALHVFLGHVPIPELPETAGTSPGAASGAWPVQLPWCSVCVLPFSY